MSEKRVSDMTDDEVRALAGAAPGADPVGARLAKIKERAEAATRGPWEAEDDEDCWRLLGAVTPNMHPLQLIKAPKRDTPFAEYWPNPADAEFIAHARTDVPALAAALEAVLAEIEKAKRASDVGWVNPAKLREAIESALRDAQEAQS